MLLNTRPGDAAASRARSSSPFFELEQQVLRVVTLAAEAIDSDAQVSQLCLLLGLLLRALFALLDRLLVPAAFLDDGPLL